MRLRRTLALFLLTALSTTVTAPTASAAGSLPVYLNGSPLTLDPAPVLVQDRLLVPLRGYMEALGAKVGWQPPDAVTVQWEDRTVSLRIGDTTARVGPTTVSMDVPAQLISDRTYVPLRFLSEGLGAQVAYDGTSVRVTSPTSSRIVVDGPLNVRSAPNTSAPILMTVPEGTRFGVLGGDIQWTQVALPRGRTGWVATRYIDKLPERPPVDPYADLLAGPTGYLQVQGQCLGTVPNPNGTVMVPLGPTAQALGAAVTDQTVRLGDQAWTATPSDLVQIADQSFVPARSLAQGLGLTLTWDGARRTASLVNPGGATTSDLSCNPAVSTPSYLIMDARSGLVLSEKQADKARPVASITKIMTGLLALERGNLAGVITASKNAAGQTGTRMGLLTGDKIKLSDMMYGLMLPSGNDAATAIAEFLSGSEPVFAATMTQRAKDLGATNTLFYNASGLDDFVQPYSTARDMALIARTAMQNPDFRAVVSRKDYSFAGPRGTWTLTNKNDFVKTYPGATGVKNGWTEAAGYTLVESAYRDGVELIVVLLGQPNRATVYTDAASLMDQGFKLAGSAWLLHR